MNFMTCSKERILLRRALIYIYCAIKSVVIGTYYVYVYHLNHLGGLKNKDSLYTIVLYLSSSHLQNFWFLAKLQNSMTVQISLQIPFAYIVFYCEKPPPTSVYHFTYSYTISEPDILIHHDSSFLTVSSRGV